MHRAVVLPRGVVLSLFFKKGIIADGWHGETQTPPHDDFFLERFFQLKTKEETYLSRRLMFVFVYEYEVCLQRRFKIEPSPKKLFN